MRKKILITIIVLIFLMSLYSSWIIQSPVKGKVLNAITNETATKAKTRGAIYIPQPNASSKKLLKIRPKDPAASKKLSTLSVAKANNTTLQAPRVTPLSRPELFSFFREDIFFFFRLTMPA